MNQSPRKLSAALTGRSFVHPVFDYLLIGGGLSLIVTRMVISGPQQFFLIDLGFTDAVKQYLEQVSRQMYDNVPYFILLCNSAHFAASTVRLYTKPHSKESLPFLTMAFPVIVLSVLTLCLYEVDRLGDHLTSLYLTWSPYHYAAQAYGIAVIYSYRSGCQLSTGNKKLLWWVSMLPFFHNFFHGPRVGLHWLLPADLLANPTVDSALSLASANLPTLAYIAIAIFFVKVWFSRSGPMPVISILAVITNGIWFFLLPEYGFVWATIFHGVQYMAIVMIFHVRDRSQQPGRKHSWFYHTVWFYSISVLLAYALFHCLPLAYVFAGFGVIESVLLVTATINIHHFIVDAYIWRLKKTDRNRTIVYAGTPAR